MKLRFIKTDVGLSPFDSEASESIKKWKNGDFIIVESKRPRNYKFHKKFYALMNIIFENTDEFKTLDNLVDYMKIQTGHSDIIEARGIAFRVPKSIAFQNMTQDNFDSFFNRAVDECLLLVPIGKLELEREILRFG